MHESTFMYVKPTDNQLVKMASAGSAVDLCSKTLEETVPEGPDRTYLIRKLREVAMWANVAITRQPDGAPRG